MIMTCHKPTSPPRICSPSELLREAHALKSDFFFCTPNYPEVSTTYLSIKYLKSLIPNCGAVLVEMPRGNRNAPRSSRNRGPIFLTRWSHSLTQQQLFGGGRMDREAGDLLQANGINLYSVYGWWGFRSTTYAQLLILALSVLNLE